MRCPECNKDFVCILELKSKPDVYMCEKDGLFYLNKKKEWGKVEYPCPKCGIYFKPFKHDNGRAYMICKEHGEYNTSILVSFNFRGFCSRIAKKPNRSPYYYTSEEKKVRKMLIDKGFKEGIDFHHNFQMINGKHHYYLDFYLPKNKISLEASPALWHELWGRKESDDRKYKFLKSKGITVIELTDKNEKEWKKMMEIIK